MKHETIINIASLILTAIATSVAIWQAIEAKNSSRDALQAALSTQRLGVCLQMNSDIEIATEQIRWSSIVDKPYDKNEKFLYLTAAIHDLGENAKIFKQMMPTNSTEAYFKDVFDLRISLKDMISDGSDFLSKKDIINKLELIKFSQKSICDDIFKP